MSERTLDGLAPNPANGDAILIEPRGIEQPRNGIAPAKQTDALAQFEREQIAREIADIERATAALRRAEPALQSWIKPPPPAAAKPRPLWLLIGALWLSTALVTAGTVAVIATFAG